MRHRLQTALFNLGVSLLLAHELDAMLRTEWVLLPVLKDMSSQSASWAFIYLHIPVALAVLYLGNAPNRGLREAFRGLTCGFLAVHAVIHYTLSDVPAYDFHHLLSQLLIYTAGLCGGAFLIVKLRS
ncbi:MAG: DUF6713 family protein [Panacagrimonas sp.]